MGKVYAVVSGKGGTGKSTFVSNMGALLAAKGKSVVLIDMDMGLRALDVYMGLESRVVYNVYDVISGLCRIKQALIKDKRFDNLYLIGASPVVENSSVTRLHMKVLCRRLAEKFDYVILDAPAGVSDGFYLTIAGADKAIVVTEPLCAACRDAEVIEKILDDEDIGERCCVINKVKPELAETGSLPSVCDIMSHLRMPLAGIIQYDDNIYIASNSGVPIVFKTDSYIYENFENIVDRITEE